MRPPPAPARGSAPEVKKPSGPPSMFLGGKPIEVLGKMYYRTAGGDLIDLPSDMTAAQVIQLEADARAAVTKVGKGPPPQPVPDVKKLDKKEDKKTPLKPFAKGKKFGAGGKGSRKPKAGGSPGLSKVGKGKVAQYLAAKAAPIVAKGFARLQQLRTSQQTHDEAADKRTQAEASVVIPASEGQSKSNSAQVKVVGDRPAPKVDANKGKQTLQEKLRENMPRKIEEVDNFKRDMKGQHTGAEVLKTMQTDKSAVVSTFQDMGHTPPPAPREHEPQALPPTEIAPAAGAMNLGKDGIAPLQKEHTDLSNYTNQADKKLTEEGVTQEQLDMVDSGDLASANKEKKGMQTAAKTEPEAVQKFSQEQGKNVEKDLKQEETKHRADMNTKRKTGLGATRAKQQGAKSELEKKREEVAAKVNGIYTAAQDKVKKRLADLETQSMTRFDDGNAKATKLFEDNVNRDIDAFKEDRYSGWFGWARKIRDWIKGIDDLPPVKAIFDRNREKFVATINKLVEDISADNKRVIQECKDELQRARAEIKDYVDKLGPSLKDIGKKAADEMNSKLDDLDKFVAKKEEDLQNKLKDKQAAAIKAIDEKIEKMKEAMAGALAKLGKLLLLAAKKFFTWALQKFGYSLAEIEGIINRGAAVLKAIFTKPIQFVKNLMNAAILGFKNFGKNFLKHLQDALFEWLTGSLQGLILPQTWDPKGIVSVALQMIGISKQSVREVMEEVMGKHVVEGLLKTFTLMQTLITQGPMAAWEQLKDIAGEMRDAFIDAVKDFIKWKIVEEAIKWVGALLIPGAGIVKAIIGIYDTVVFFIQKAKQIMEMISNFLSSMGEIAAGNITAAADAMEKGLARGLSLVINFLAALLRLTGITNKIREALNKIRGKVRGVLVKLAKWVWEKGKALLGKAVTKAKAGVASVVKWWRQRKTFNDGQQEHALYFKGEWPKAQLIIESDPHPIRSYYANLKSLGFKDTDPEMINIMDAIKSIEKVNAASGGNFSQTDGKTIKAALDQIVSSIKSLTGKSLPKTAVKWTSKSIDGNKVGKKMSATVLGINPGGHAGSAPHQTNALWHAVNQRTNAYVLGHLLNHHLHGKGEAENLVPIARTTNTTMSARVEEKIKAAVFKDRQSVYYEVDVIFGAQPSRKIPQEEKLPTRIDFVAYTLKADNKTKKADLSIPASLPHNLPPNDPLNRPREVINLNRLPSKERDAIAKLDTIPQVGESIAKKIVYAVRQIKKTGPVHRYAQITAQDPSIPSNVLDQLETDGWVTLYPH